MLFYLVFPVFFILLRGVPAKVAAYLLAGSAYYGLTLLLRTAPEGVDTERYALLTVVHYLPTFLIGMMAFDVVDALHARGATWRTGAAFLAAGILGFAGVLEGLFPEPAIMPVLRPSAAYACMLIGLAFCPVRLVVNRATRFLGQISYSVYLLHGPVILLINRTVFPRVYALPLPTSARFALALAVTLVITLAASWFAYRVVERPGIAVGRRLIESRRQRHRLAAQPG
jgi:peptidoglycan/LPS O-acetylase OafA/YrhL